MNARKSHIETSLTLLYPAGPSPCRRSVWFRPAGILKPKPTAGGISQVPRASPTWL